MSLFNQTIPLDFPLREVIAAFGVHAQRAGHTAVAEACLGLVHTLDESAVATVNPDMAALLCAAADALRLVNNAPAVAQVERIVSLVREASPPRHIVGTIGMDVRRASQLDVQYEKLRRIVVQRVGE